MCTIISTLKLHFIRLSLMQLLLSNVSIWSVLAMRATTDHLLVLVRVAVTPLIIIVL